MAACRGSVMRYLTLVLALAAVPVCAAATGALQNNNVRDGQVSEAPVNPAAQASVRHHEPLIKIRYVLLPPAISGEGSSIDEVKKTSVRFDGGTTNRVNTEINQIERCAQFDRVRC